MSVDLQLTSLGSSSTPGMGAALFLWLTLGAVPMRAMGAALHLWLTLGAVQRLQPMPGTGATSPVVDTVGGSPAANALDGGGTSSGAAANAWDGGGTSPAVDTMGGTGTGGSTLVESRGAGLSQ